MRHTRLVFLLAAGLLAGCSHDDSPSDGGEPDSRADIRFAVDTWRVMEGTRATTFDSNTDLQGGTFACYAYEHGGTTQYIGGSTVSYSSGEWTFDDGKHYWPATGALDFFAYMPANLTNTHCTIDPTAYDSESNTDGYSSGCARLACTNLPVSITAGSDDTEELVWAYTADQDKAGTNTSAQPTAGQVALTLKHPFARLIFKLSTESGTNVKVNSITIGGIKNNGTATFDGTTTTWTPSGDAADLVISGNPATSATNSYLVVPQTFAANLTFTVNATWDDWSAVTKDVTASVNVGSWQPGNSYTYNLTLSKYALKVDTEKYTEQW